MSTVTGFILTRQWKDSRQGLVLKYWLHTPQGPLLVEQTQQEGIFFIEAQHLENALSLTKERLHRTRPLALKSFSQQPVTGFYFTHQRDLRAAANRLKENGIEPLEADVRTVDRYLMERFITATMTVSAGLIEQRGSFHRAQNAVIKPIEFEPSLRVISFDIETSLSGDQLYSIAVYGPDIQQVFMWGQTPLNNGQVFNDERSLLIAFMAWLQAYDPDILIGWNCINFDLRFLEKTCQRLNLPLNLGRNAEPLEWRTTSNNEGHYFVLIPGRAVLDGIDTLKSATYNFESFSLEFVARTLLGKGKLIHDPDDRGEEITRLFHDNPQALADYNLEDCALVWEIFDKTHLIQFAIERAKLTGLPLDKVGGSVAAFENQYLPRLHRQGYVAPNLPSNPQGVGSPGGYVMDSRPGLYEHVLVLDFKSLYPSIIRSFKVDPYGLAEADALWHADDDTTPPALKEIAHYVPGYRGAYFRKQQSILPTLIEHLWLARDKAKQQHNQALSQAIKIIMNSFYGVMGTPGCRFFDPRLPSSITLRGHAIMNQTRTLIEQKGYEVIYGDTDSIFVWLNQTLTNEQADSIGADLVDYVNDWWQEHLQSEYQLESALELEYENHYSKFLMPTMRGSSQGTKKRYAGLIETTPDEQYTTERKGYRLVFKGLENVRTDWTPLAREFQKSLYERIFLGHPYKDFIRQIVQEIRDGQHDQQMLFRKRLRRKLADYQKNIPPHVQAARKADEWLTQQGRRPRYQNRGWIEYAYTTHGPEPVECLTSPLDYDLYLERQIVPIVDGIVMFLGESFSEITSHQMNLL